MYSKEVMTFEQALEQFMQAQSEEEERKVIAQYVLPCYNESEPNYYKLKGGIE